MALDISMSRDLVRRRKNAGYAAICGVGFQSDRRVFRLATALNIEAHLPLIQPGTWEKLVFVRVVWTPGLAVARTIATGAEQFLTDTGHALGQHWFRADLSLLDDLILAEAMSLNAPTWTQRDLIDRLQRQADREADRYAEGTF